MIRATGGQWVEIDPREWKNQFNLEVNVGLGTGNKDQITQHLQTLWQAMGMGAQAGIVTPANLYQAGIKLAENLGFNQPELFWTDPQTLPPKQPPVDPQVITAQAMVQIEQQKMALEERKAVAKIAQEDRKIEAQIELNRTEMALKYGLKAEEQAANLISNEVVSGQSATGYAPGTSAQGFGVGNSAQQSHF